MSPLAMRLKTSLVNLLVLMLPAREITQNRSMTRAMIMSAAQNTAYMNGPPVLKKCANVASGFMLRSSLVLLGYVDHAQP
jgi:hypothetical protein